jgi:hypothetical protein
LSANIAVSLNFLFSSVSANAVLSINGRPIKIWKQPALCLGEMQVDRAQGSPAPFVHTVKLTLAPEIESAIALRCHQRVRHPFSRF